MSRLLQAHRKTCLWAWVLAFGLGCVASARAVALLPQPPMLAETESEAGAWVELAWLADPMTFPYPIKVKANAAGTPELFGCLPSAAVKARAIDLARPLVGPTALDRLSVPPGMAFIWPSQPGPDLLEQIQHRLKAAGLRPSRPTVDDRGIVTLAETDVAPGQAVRFAASLRGLPGVHAVRWAGAAELVTIVPRPAGAPSSDQPRITLPTRIPFDRTANGATKPISPYAMVPGTQQAIVPGTQRTKPRPAVPIPEVTESRSPLVSADALPPAAAIAVPAVQEELHLPARLLGSQPATESVVVPNPSPSRETPELIEVLPTPRTPPATMQPTTTPPATTPPVVAALTQTRLPVSAALPEELPTESRQSDELQLEIGVMVPIQPSDWTMERLVREAKPTTPPGDRPRLALPILKTEKLGRPILENSAEGPKSAADEK